MGWSRKSILQQTNEEWLDSNDFLVYLTYKSTIAETFIRTLKSKSVKK